MIRLLYRAVLAFLLTATGLCLVVLMPQAARTQPGNALPEGIGAVALLYAGTLTLVYACRVAWHVGRADACRWYHRKQERTKAEEQHAEAMAAVAAEHAGPPESVYDAWMQGVPTDGTAALRPLGPTPTSEEELATWGPAGRPMDSAPVAADRMQQQTVGYTAVMPTVRSDVTWGFGPAGVIQPPPSEPWTPPMSVLGGRHAGMPSERDELDLSVWDAHEYEGAR